mmetsp:Transcript_29152/g.64645  ORF Transcript_29152/g.64645 Transcript_29152/m.64645 type:complete len:146 (+) Transcript_29152:1397-1834(+)
MLWNALNLDVDAEFAAILLLAAIIEESVPILEPRRKTRLPPGCPTLLRAPIPVELVSVDMLSSTEVELVGDKAAVEVPLLLCNAVERAALLAALDESVTACADIVNEIPVVASRLSLSTSEVYGIKKANKAVSCIRYENAMLQPY